MRRVLAIAALIVSAVNADVAAQIVQRPSRPYRGLFGGGPTPDPNRTRSELTFSGGALVGYDTWLSPGGQECPIRPPQRQSGLAMAGEAALAYFRGRANRSISIDGRADTNGYSGIDADTTIGGNVVVAATTNLGPVMQLRAFQSFAYEPTLVLGGSPIVDGGVDAPVAPEVTSGYLDQRSWSSDSSVNLSRRWTARQTTQVAAAYSRSTYLDNFGYDTSTRVADLTHTWLFSRTSSLGAHYGFSDSDSDAGDGLSTPMTDQSLDLSFGYTRRLSPSRQLLVEVGGGATHVSTLNRLDRSGLSYWMPSGNGSVSLDVGRSWSIRANYSRDGERSPRGVADLIRVELGRRVGQRTDQLTDRNVAVGDV